MYYERITMEIAQFRIPKGLMDEVNALVQKGLYSNKSDVIRDALRRLVIENHIGTIPNDGNSVKQVRKARNELSKEIKSLKDFKNYN